MTSKKSPTASGNSDEQRVGPRTVVLTFQPRFRSLVEDGYKCCTIRPERKRPVLVGDRLSLREWTGTPYRSKQRVLRTAEVSRVARVVVGNYGTSVGGLQLTPEQEHDFACDDGFENVDDMRGWFAGAHGLPFSGVMIKWANSPLVP